MGDGWMVCTFVWCIDNYSYCRHENGERLVSPCFTAAGLKDISWWMSVYPRGEFDEDRGYISLYIGLNPADEAPDEISLNYELSVLAADGSILCSKVDKNKFLKGKGYGWPKFVGTEKIHQDTLTVRCRIWKSGGNRIFESSPVCARTRIAVEDVSFSLAVENFSAFEPNRQKKVQMHSRSEQGFAASGILYFNDDPCSEGEMIIEIRPSDSNHHLCKRKISLLGAFGNTVLCEETDNRFDVERKDIEKLPFSFTRQFLLNKKGQYLPNDRLTLLCECSFTTGMEIEKTAATERGAAAEKVFEGIPDNRNQAPSTEEALESESFTFTLKYRIKDFSTANEEVCEKTAECSDLFLILISVSVFPNGADQSDEGWLVVRPVVTVRDDFKLLESCTSLCTVSIIDVEGNSRFFRYFEISSHNVRGVKYLRKSFILERADELIWDDVFLLRCDMRTDLRVKTGYKLGSSSGTSSKSFLTFLSSVPSCEYPREGAETDDAIKIHDFTSQILTLPQFHESRKRFGVYGLPPPEWNERPEVDSTDNLEDVWIFDTESWRCLLSFDQRPGNVGRLLLDASPVIRRCINAPMKEQHERRIDLSHVNSAAFLLVLHFLESGLLSTDGFLLLKEIYEFSHLYEMENLQQKCAERMVESSMNENQRDEMKRTAFTYSDEYFLNLWELRRREFENWDVTRMDDRLNFDCYN